MRVLSLAAAAFALVLSGCASTDYKMYAETQAKIAQAQAQAEAMKESARYAALAEIAKSGDSAAKVAAVMSINFGAAGAGTSSAPRSIVMNPPKTWNDHLLQWTGVVLPSLTNLYGISANRQVAITQSNNQAAVATSTNNTFAAMNSNMATSNTSIAAAGLTATKDVATAGITGLVTSGANALTAINNVSTAANTSIQTIANTIPQIQPNVTTTTTTNNSCGSNASGGTVTCP